MSLRVTDPSGVGWDISRRWFRVPRWARRKPRLELPTEFPDVWLALDGMVVWGLLVVALALLALFALFIVMGLVLPLALLLVGVVAGLVALLA